MVIAKLLCLFLSCLTSSIHIFDFNTIFFILIRYNPVISFVKDYEIMKYALKIIHTRILLST